MLQKGVLSVIQQYPPAAYENTTKSSAEIRHVNEMEVIRRDI